MSVLPKLVLVIEHRKVCRQYLSISFRTQYCIASYLYKSHTGNIVYMRNVACSLQATFLTYPCNQHNLTLPLLVTAQLPLLLGVEELYVIQSLALFLVPHDIIMVLKQRVTDRLFRIVLELYIRFLWDVLDFRNYTSSSLWLFFLVLHDTVVFLKQSQGSVIQNCPRTLYWIFLPAKSSSLYLDQK